MTDTNTRFCPTCAQSFDGSHVRCPHDDTDLVDVAEGRDPLIGRTIGDRFTIKALLGAGGMGSVYRAVQHSVGRDVAIKVIGNKYTTNSRVAKRFVREARLTSQLTHANTVTIFDFGQTDDGMLFLVMELLAGDSLRQHLTTGRLPVTRALDIVAQIAAGLSAAHQLGIVHRDLKPANVVLTQDPEGRDVVKVLDFGVARMLESDESAITKEGFFVGTAAYLPPETIKKGTFEVRSDLYALGVMLYELLTGVQPYTADTPMALFYQHLNGTPAPFAADLGVSPAVERFVSRLMAKAPADRYPDASSAREVALQLKEREVAGSGATVELMPALAETPPRMLKRVGRVGDPPPPPTHPTKESVKSGASAERPPTRPGRRTKMEDPTVEPPVITPPIEEPVVVSIGPGVGVPKSNVPKRLDAFFGRGDELAELARLLADGKQLITVLGAGGTGKTRLSQRFISDHLDRFPGGAWFCDLSEGGSRAGILSAVGAALNVPLTGRDPDTQLAHAIAGRGRILVILDNFEQVVEHAADTIGRWLQTAPEAVFVVTSRVVLKIDGEVVFHLDPLPVDEAMALFYDRAAAVDPRFTRSAENEAAVREIVERVDGMALAVELAAARVRMLTPLQIRERLSQRFKLLRGTRRDRPARQTTLRGTIDWSWTLLSPAEQATLTQLSVFRGGWTLEAAEAVVDLDALDDAPWVMDTLEMLVDHSLVRRRETHVGRARYHMLASIRDYAEEKLGERADVAARHAAHFARWGAQDSLDALDTFGGVAHWRAMAVELDNLVAATRSGLALGRLGAAGPSARAAGMILRTRGSFAAGESFLREVLETQGMETQETAPHLWSLLGDVCRMLGRPADAGVHYDTGLAIHREAGDRRGEAVVLNSLGTLHSEQGRMGEARAHYGAALAIHREDGNRLLEGFVLDDLGVVHKEQGRLEAAREHYESALAIHREVGNQPGEASALCRLGILHMEQGRMEEARQHYEYALTICRELGNGPGEGRILSYLGGIHSVEGRMDQARRHFERALVIHRECGDRGSQGIDLGNLGDLAYGEGDLPSAAHHLEQAIGICDEVIPAAAGAFRGSLSLICGRQGDITKARELLAKGEAALRDVNALELAKLLCKRAKIEHLAGDPAESEGAIAEAESIARQLDAGPDSELGQVLADARAVMA